MKLVTTIIAMMCLVSVASADDYKHSEDVASGGATVFGFAGERVNFECYTDAADCIFKVQHRIATTWTDFQPADTSPSDTVRLFAGVPWARYFGRTGYATAADSTRMLVTPDATTDVQVWAW